MHKKDKLRIITKIDEISNRHPGFVPPEIGIFEAIKYLLEQNANIARINLELDSSINKLNVSTTCLSLLMLILTVISILIAVGIIHK